MKFAENDSISRALGYGASVDLFLSDSDIM